MSGLPSRFSLCGQILLLLSDRVPRTRAQIHDALFEPDVEVEITARIRDLRKIAGIDIPRAECRKNYRGERSYFYRVAALSPRVEAALADWRTAQGRNAA